MKYFALFTFKNSFEVSYCVPNELSNKKWCKKLGTATASPSGKVARQFQESGLTTSGKKVAKQLQESGHLDERRDSGSWELNGMIGITRTKSMGPGTFASPQFGITNITCSTQGFPAFHISSCRMRKSRSSCFHGSSIASSGTVA